jgi:hypothetical protein
MVNATRTAAYPSGGKFLTDRNLVFLRTVLASFPWCRFTSGHASLPAATGLPFGAQSRCISAFSTRVLPLAAPNKTAPSCAALHLRTQSFRISAVSRKVTESIVKRACGARGPQKDLCGFCRVHNPSQSASKSAKSRSSARCTAFDARTDPLAFLRLHPQSSW